MHFMHSSCRYQQQIVKGKEVASFPSPSLSNFGTPYINDEKNGDETIVQ